MNDTVETLCPTVRKERGLFVRLIDIEGLGRSLHPVKFEYDVEYVRETEATVVVLNPSGKTIKEFGTHTDWYGFLSSPRDPMTAAPDIAEEYAAFDGPLAVEVRVVVTESALIPAENPALGAAFGRRAYHCLPHSWMVDDDATAAHIASKTFEGRFANPPTLPPHTRTTFVAWTSADGRDKDAWARRFLAVLEEALRGLPDTAEKVRAYDYVIEALRGPPREVIRDLAEPC